MTPNKLSPAELYAFQIMIDFVSDIKNCFGDKKTPKIKAFNLYHRLISKMSFEDKSLITKHIELFKHFCVGNREAIQSKNTSFVIREIKFTDRIYIDMCYIFKLAESDTSTENTLWEYIWSLSALLDSQSKTKQLLSSAQLPQYDSASTGNSTGNEGNFLAGMMKTLGTSLGEMNTSECAHQVPPTNPMEMMAGLMNSDLLSGLMNSVHSNLESGKIDLGKLMGTMQTMVKSVQTEIEKTDDPMLKNMDSMLTNAMPPADASKDLESE